MSFNLAVVLPRWITYCVNCGTEGVNPPTPSNHRLRHGLPGYLILFATHAFEPQRQLVPSRPPSPLVFLPISTHSTATPGIPSTSALLKKNSFESNSWVEPMVFTSNFLPACAPFTPSNSGHGPDSYGRQQWGILHNGGNPDAATPRGGRRSSDCKLLLLRKIMTVLNKEVTANYVPAAAVKRRSQALSGITGCKGSVGGMPSQL